MSITENFKSQIIEEGRAGAATKLKEKQGKYGNRMHWAIDDGSYIVTSSAHHYLASSAANDPQSDMAWLGRMFTGQSVHDDPNLVSETVVFDSDKEGNITDLAGVAKLFVPESHEEVMKLAGYTLKETA